jgi:hypothetical protein
MRSWVNLVYLVTYICMALIQYAHLPAVPQHPYVYVWAIAPLAYTFLLGITGTRAGFWRGLLLIVMFPVAAQLIECVVYLLRTSGFQHRDSDTVVLLGFYLIGPVGAAILWYPLGFLASWLLVRRFPSVFRAADSSTTRVPGL